MTDKTKKTAAEAENIKNGLLIIVSGPSGVGKGTVLKELRNADPNIVPSISATTRKPRKGETDGVNYFFKTESEFDLMIERGEFMEWAVFSGNKYGTPRAYVSDNLSSGRDVLLEIDVQGALKLMNDGAEGIYIFIAPESLDVLRERLRGRGTEDEAEVERRVKAAEWELTQKDKYDYVVINRVVSDAAAEIENIIRKSKKQEK